MKKNRRDNLQCSYSWFLRFKERIKLKLVRQEGERKSLDTEVVNTWRKIEIPKIIIDWQKDFIYNCDEIGLFWRQVPIKTYFISKTDHIGDTIFNERISILFCVNRNGDKLPPLVIGRSVNPRCFFGNCLANLNLTYTAQQNAWMVKNYLKNG